jgi:hypothetical protein
MKYRISHSTINLDHFLELIRIVIVTFIKFPKYANGNQNKRQVNSQLKINFINNGNFVI